MSIRFGFVLCRAFVCFATTLAALQTSIAFAEVKVPNVFSDHMVLQRDQPNKLWGHASANEKVTVKFADQTLEATANAAGDWSVMLPALPAGGPHTIAISGSSQIEIKDVLVGEVWICSGQSNMQWNVNSSTDSDLERLAAKHPNIRMINFPQIGTQEPIWSHDDRRWQVCTPDTVGGFSAVGYFFARQIHDTIDVPVGMINNAWGGSAAEAWVNRDVLKANPRFEKLLANWSNMESRFDALSKQASRNEAEEKEFKNLANNMRGNHRPANIYNGVLKSHIGYGLRGAIWYQGESNAGRAYQYRDLFPAMITNWRQEWGQGDFPFYWVQLADFRDEVTEPKESDWAELREAQTLSMDKLPNSGQAVIIDIGEGKDIHPMNKVDVGRRLARWALAKQYGVSIDYQSPRYASMEKSNDAIVLSFNNPSGGWRPFDVPAPIGFTIAGEDKKFVNANAKILDDGRISVSHPSVPNPVAVRYAWADNPICNMYGKTGLPLTPFRTDDWPGVTAGRE